MKRFVAFVCLSSFLSGVFGQSISSVLSGRTSSMGTSNVLRQNLTTANATTKTADGLSAESLGEAFQLVADPRLA
ncbi:MAG: hypothetical protein HDR38_08750, partial [Treponema sp.]|nr:hypothetical protein [Treponema sp.]